MPTNREWLNNLASTDIPGLDAWMNAEHTEDNPLTDSLMRGVVEHIAENDANGGSERLSDGADVKSDGVNSREKLEADVYRAADKMDAFYCGERFLDTRKIIGWLDRQEAITHSIDAWNIERLEKQVAELQAELDKWRKLTANIELPDYPMTQFVPKDEWRKLEADIHDWLTSHVGVSVYTNEIEAEAKKWMNKAANIRGREIGFRMENWAKRVDDQSREIDKLQAERDAIKAKLDYLKGNGIDISEPFCGGYEVYDDRQGRVNELEAERDYWKDQIISSLACACKPGGYAAGVMKYPRPDGYTEPSLLINDTIYSLRDFHADDQKEIVYLRRNHAALLDAMKEAHVSAFITADGAWHVENRLQDKLDKQWTYIEDATDDYAKLVQERDNLAADLKECMELNDRLSDEREKWRGTCGMMIDKAHEIQRIMDGIGG